MERTYGMTNLSQLLRPLCLFLSKNRFLVCLVKQRMRKIVSRKVSSDRLKMSMIRLNRTNESTNKWTNERKNEKWMKKSERMRINEMNDWNEMTDEGLAGLVGQCQHDRMSRWTNEHTKERKNWKIDEWMSQRTYCVLVNDNSMTCYDFDFLVYHELIK